MSSSSDFLVPDGQYPPFAVVTDYDHAAWIIIPTALGFVCTLFFAGVRILVRRAISDGSALDDYLLYGATGLAMIQSSLVLGACSNGLGKALDLISPAELGGLQNMYYTSNLFFIMAIGLAKISVVRLLHRISRSEQHRLVFNIATGLIGAWIVASVFALALQCDLHHPWISVDQKCPGMRARWLSISALDIALEVGIIGLVVYLLYDLQTPMARKAIVVGIFSFRLLIIIFIAFRMDTFDSAGYTTNPYIREASFIAWTQSELNYSLISATIPTFQSFLKNLNTGFGGIGAGDGKYGYGYGSGSGSRARKESHMSYQMSKMRSTNESVAIDEPHEELHSTRAQEQRANLDMNSGTTVAIVGQGNGGAAANGETTSIESDGSGKMMIRKDMQWSIRTEPRE